MPPNAPVFVDVATRLRHSHVNTGDMATAAIEATTATSTLRLPSTRPLDYRWDRSRGIIFNNALRSTCRDRAWRPGGTVPVGTVPAITRSYAVRPVGSPTTQKADQKADRKIDYVENAHKISGFNSMSNKQATDLKDTIIELEKDVAKKGEEIRQLRADAKAKDDTNATLAQDLKASRQSREEMKVTHQKEVETLRRSARQEKEAHTSALRKVKDAHAKELQHTEQTHEQELQDARKTAADELETLRQSAAESIARNAPILEAARREGEEAAKKRFDQELHDQSRRFKAQHTQDSERMAEQGAQIKALQAEKEDLESRLRNERQQHGADIVSVKSSVRSELDDARRHAGQAHAERAAALERNKRLIVRLNETQQLLDGKKARELKDRVNYFGYRELFRNVFDQTYEALASGNQIRDALLLEGNLWTKSAKRFQTSDELLFLRQQPKYNMIKRSINEFLESRSREAHAAAAELRSLSNQMLETRNVLSLHGHASRMVTRYLHFTKEPSEFGAVSTVQYMALVLPFQQRLNECEKQIADLESRIEESQKQSSDVPAELEDELAERQKERRTLKNYVMYAEAFRRREAYQALLNSSAEERLTFGALYEQTERLNEVSSVLGSLETRTLAVGGSISPHRTSLVRTKAFQEEVASLAQKRITLGLELGQVKQVDIDKADAKIKKHVAAQKLLEDRALAAIAGERISAARTLRERRAERLRAAHAGSKYTGSADHPRAPLESGMRHRSTTTSNVSARHAVNSVTRSPAAPGKRILYLSKTIKQLQRSKRLNKVGTKGGKSVKNKLQRDAAIDREIAKLEAKRRQAEIEQSTQNGSGSILEDTPSNPPQSGISEEQNASPAPAGATSGLKFTPSSAMRAPFERGLSQRQTRLAQWSTLSDALGSQNDVAIGFAPREASLDAVLSARIPSAVRTTSGQASELNARSGIPMGTSVDQSSSQDATSRDFNKTRAPGSQTTSSDQYSSIDGQHDSMLPQRSSADNAIGDTVEVSPPSSLSSYVPSDSDDPSDAESAEEEAWKPEPHTILDYQIPREAYRDAVMASPNTNAAYWSHQLYKSLDGKSPVVYYCKTLETAERQCKHFIGEPVLGFDLEWEVRSNLYTSSVKKSVSLIQIAAEDKICLIHVALFAGEKIEQLLPPSLKTILEDPNVAKAGVNVNNDAIRMKHCFGVNMQGIFELSHMYRLVKTPEKVSFKLVNMAEQVQNTLLLPLKKDEVRVSAWSKSLSGQQAAYAAADAYAGFRLFYQLDNLRKDLRPTPPRPAYFETMQPIVLGDGTAVERSKSKTKPVSKKDAAVAENEDEDEFFDALEELPETYELDKVVTAGGLSSERKTTKDGELDIDEADPDSVSALRDMLDKTTLEDRSSSAGAGQRDSKSAGSTGNTAPDANKTAKPSPHVLVASPETLLADMWIQSLPSRNPKVGAASLRAYHLWHHQSHNLDAVAGLCRQPPLALTTVSSYIMTAIKEEEMPYDKERLREAFVHLPKSVWYVYGKWVRELGLDK
ncbi:hypothetical protein CBER1_07010 [Cercospora berteroae]|uniref:3'-5' exonuclease domain-containing protein n=1 Tax=Cercospora berteroae TaxID=357750 RepID=A0A2S6CBR4_9PEZI|nr:hypothetical protein CBER1_07010 [Cercospora berteroae]